MKTKYFKNTFQILMVMLFIQCDSRAQERPPDGHPPKPKPPKELIKTMDKNNDNKISKEEIRGPLAKDFDKVDINKDGFLTLEELNKMPRPPKRD
jgi:Ca2+-binding EF-hand superfamily protein